MTSVLPTITFCCEDVPVGVDDEDAKTQFIFTTQDGAEITLSQEEAARFLAEFDSSRNELGASITTTKGDRDVEDNHQSPLRDSLPPEMTILDSLYALDPDSGDAYSVGEDATGDQPKPYNSKPSTTTMEAIPLDQLDEQLRQLLLEVASTQNAEMIPLCVEDSSKGEPLNLVYVPATQTVLVEMDKAHELQEANEPDDVDYITSSSFSNQGDPNSMGAVDGSQHMALENTDEVIPAEVVVKKRTVVRKEQSYTKLKTKTRFVKREKKPCNLNEDDPFSLEGGGGGFADALASIGHNVDLKTSIKIACEMYKKYRLPRRQQILKKMSKIKELMTMTAPQPYPEQNEPGTAPTFNNYSSGAYKINFAMVADRIESELNYYGINQATFAHFVCQRSQTRFSELLTEARVEGFYCRSKAVFEIYRRMESWLKQPLKDRIVAYNQWLQERGHGSKKKGFIHKSTLASALKGGSDLEAAVSAVNSLSPDVNARSKTLTKIYVNESGEYIHSTTEAKERSEVSKDKTSSSGDAGESGKNDFDDDVGEAPQEVNYYESYAFMAFDLEDELKWFNVSRESFSRAILGRSKSRFSEIMGEAKALPFACKSSAVVKQILRLCEWMSKPIEERCSKYLKWRVDVAKYIEEPAPETVDGSSQKLIPLTIQTDTGEVFSVQGVVEEKQEEAEEVSALKGNNAQLANAKFSKFQTEVLKSRIDFRAVALRLERELKAYDVGLTMFMKNLLPDITLAAFSQMLKDSKSKNFACKRRSTLEKFKLIDEWLKQSEYERVQTYKMWKEPDAEPPRQVCVAALEARAIAQSVLRELIDNDISQKEFARNILNAPSAVLCMMLRKASEDLTDVTAPKAVKALLCMKDWMELGDTERAMAYQAWRQASGGRCNVIKKYGKQLRQFVESNMGVGTEVDAIKGDEVPSADEDDTEDFQALFDDDHDVDGLLEPVSGVVHCVEYSLYKEDGIILDFHNIGRMFEQEIDLFKASIVDISEIIVGRGEKTLSTLMSHAKISDIKFSYGKTVDTFQVLAEWLETPLEARLLNYSAWDHRDRSGLVIQVTRSAHFINTPYEVEMNLLSLEDVRNIADQESDEVYWQFMKNLEIDLEVKRCILPVFAKSFLETPSYSVMVAAFKLAKRFAVQNDQGASALFHRIKQWFQIPDEERTALCRSWMCDNVDILWRKKVKDLRERIWTKACKSGATIPEEDLPPIPSLTVLVPRPRRGRPPKTHDTSSKELPYDLVENSRPSVEENEDEEEEEELSFFASGRPKRKASKINNYKKFQDGFLDAKLKEEAKHLVLEESSNSMDEDIGLKPGVKRRHKDAKYSRYGLGKLAQMKRMRLLGKTSSAPSSEVAGSHMVTVETADGDQVVVLVEKNAPNINLDLASDNQTGNESDCIEEEAEENEEEEEDNCNDHDYVVENMPKRHKTATRVSAMELPNGVSAGHVEIVEVKQAVVASGEQEAADVVEKKVESVTRPTTNSSVASLSDFSAGSLVSAEDIPCRFCAEVFVEKNDYVAHMKEKHEDARPYYCNTCKSGFFTAYGLERHRQMVCGKKLNRSLPKRKATFMSASEDLRCVGCERTFSSVGALESHALDCTRGENYEKREETGINGNQLQCFECLETFEDRASRDLHVAIGVHSHSAATKEQVASVPMEGKTLKLYDCKTCGKVLTTKLNLRNHVLGFHSKNSNNDCPICHKKFSTSQNLGRHIRSHFHLKSYKCDLCNQEFTEKKSMQIHMRLHTGERPYTCERCNKSFVQKGTYNIHLKTHWEHKNFRCNLCTKIFKTVRHLKNHERCHVPDQRRPYLCHKCPRGFFTDGSLSQHLLMHVNKAKASKEARDAMIIKSPSNASASATGPDGAPSNCVRILTNFSVPTCYVCQTAVENKETLAFHMQDHGLSVDTCDICGQKYDDYLSAGQVMMHRKHHELGSQVLDQGGITSSHFMDIGALPESSSDQIIITGEGGEIMILQGSGHAMQPQQVDSQYEQHSIDGEFYISDSGDLQKRDTSATTSTHSSNFPTDDVSSRVVTVQDSNGLVFNVQIDENHQLSSLMAEGGIATIDPNSENDCDPSSLQYVVLDPSSC